MDPTICLKLLKAIPIVGEGVFTAKNTKDECLNSQELKTNKKPNNNRDLCKKGHLYSDALTPQNPFLIVSAITASSSWLSLSFGREKLMSSMVRNGTK